MLERWSKLLRKDPANPRSEEDRFALAACVLLLEVAYSDDEFSPVEREAILASLRERFELDEAGAAQLIEKAEQARTAAVDLFQFSQLINKEFAEDDKIRILEYLWQVVYADGAVDQHEEFLMRRLSTLLDLSHTKMIDAKLRARDG